LLRAFEKKLIKTIEVASPSIACVVVSRSEFYPKVPDTDETPGKLGDFDPKAFLKKDASPEREKLARLLDLSNPRTIPDHGFAGGVVIDKAGYVLTPYHVIDGAKKVYVYLAGGSGSYADIHAADARSDLAVLRLHKPPKNLKAIEFADVRTVESRDRKPNVRRGTLVILMANPYASGFRLGQSSAAFGSITNVRHRQHEPARAPNVPAPPRVRYTEYGTLLEYDVKPNAGVTGGALLNLDAELIGMTNAAAVAWGKEIGPGYAVPCDANFRRIVDVLRRGEEVEYGFLGVQKLGERTAIEPIPGGAAARARIRSGDSIVAMNGVPLESFDDLQTHTGSALAGSKVKVSVRGLDGETREVDVTLGKLRNDQPFIASVRSEPVFGLRVDYVTVLSDQPKKGTRIPLGVAVREVVADSPAARRFKELGDNPERWLVTQVNGAEVMTPGEFYKATRGQETVKLTLTDPKDGSRRELTLP
jgi:serine protease Do